MPQLRHRETSARQSVAIHKSAQADSNNDYSASAECMDCHATASAVSRNDGKRALRLESAFCDLSLWIASPPLSARNDDWLSSSRILGIAVGLWELCGFWGRLATLAVVPFTKQGTPLADRRCFFRKSATLPHCSPKTESPQEKVDSSGSSYTRLRSSLGKYLAFLA